MKPRSSTTYYFGEDVDVYKNGKVAGHGGSWLSGVKGAKFGLMMPGKPKVGQRFYQEQAPGVAQEKGMRDHKWYAASVGPVKDGEMVLVQYGKK